MVFEMNLSICWLLVLKVRETEENKTFLFINAYAYVYTYLVNYSIFFFQVE